MASKDTNDKETTKNNKERPEGNPPPGLPRPPRHPMIATWQYLFWALLLIIVPLIGYYGMHDEEPVVQLSQKQFEEKLTSGLVTKMRVIDNNASNIWEIQGEYHDGVLPDDGVRQLGDSANKPQTHSFRSQVIYSDALDEMIREHGPEASRMERGGSFFGSLIVMFLPTLLLIGFFWLMFVRQSRGGGMMSFGKSRARKLEPGKDPITFKDVAGCDEAKEDMQEVVEYLRDPKKFSRLGGRIPRGVLLAGPPGTGKTLLAKAIAGEAKVPFYSISGSDFVEMFVGVGASRVRDMFEEGKKNAPCLIFIDEIDAVGRSRFSGIGGGHDEREQTLNALLVEMDGFETNQGVIVIAATNRPDVLDPALLRPGRFDRQITVDLPDLRGRFAILKIHAAKTKLAEEVDLRVIARGTPGFSGADLANLINEAALGATRKNHDAVDMMDLEEARDKVRWGKERRSHRLDDKVRKITAYHEAGHALIGMLCPNAMPLHKITIIPRGASLGATMSLPENDEVMKSKKELLDFIAVCYGGRTAEELIFGDVSTGAAMDIKQATDIAKKMVCQWGMSERLGLVNYSGGREEHIFIGRDITRAEDFSQETAREIDLEIRHIVDTECDRVHHLLQENLDKLKLLAETLLDRETLMAHEVYQLLGMEEPESKRSAEDLAHDFDDPVLQELRQATTADEPKQPETSEDTKPEERPNSDEASSSDKAAAPADKAPESADKQ